MSSLFHEGNHTTFLRCHPTSYEMSSQIFEMSSLFHEGNHTTFLRCHPASYEMSSQIFEISQFHGRESYILRMFWQARNHQGIYGRLEMIRIRRLQIGI